MNEVLAALPIAYEKDNFSELSSLNPMEAKALRYEYNAGALGAFNALLRKGYSIAEAGKAHQKVSIPAFRPEKDISN